MRLERALDMDRPGPYWTPCLIRDAGSLDNTRAQGAIVRCPEGHRFAIPAAGISDGKTRPALCPTCEWGAHEGFDLEEWENGQED